MINFELNCWQASDTSNDGATNFAARFGDNWHDYIYHACVSDSQQACTHVTNADTCDQVTPH